MALSVTFDDINSLSEFSFIAGSTYTIKFTVVDQSGSAIDIGDATCTWKLSSFGTDNSILNKTGNVIATNVFEILLAANDTVGFSGKFSHQPTITFSNGVVVKPAQGIITIIKGIS